MRENYKMGLEQIKNEDFEGAISVFNEIISKDSTIYEVYQSRGYCYFKTGSYENAINDYQIAFSSNYNPQLLFNLGMCYVKLERFDLALGSFNQFELKDSLNKDLWLQKALCLSQLKEYSIALDYYNKAESYFSDSIKLLKNIGVCHFQLSNHYSTIDVLKTYLDTIKDDQSIYEMIAFSYHELGAFDKAKSYFDQMTELGMEMEEKTQTLYNSNLLKLGEKQYNKKSFVAALQSFTKVIELDPENKEAYFNRGLVKLYYEKRKEACEDFNFAFSKGHPKAIAVMKKNCKEYFN